jgi:hypothetical protein
MFVQQNVRRSYGKLFGSWFSFRLTSHHHHRHIAECAFAVALLQLTMGLTISSIFGRLFGNQERRILMGACLYCSHLSTSDRGGGGRDKRTSNTQHTRMPFHLICPWIAHDGSADMAHPHTRCCVSMYACVCVFCCTVGLDAAGKTTILYKLKLGEIVTTIPTIGA